MVEVLKREKGGRRGLSLVVLHRDLWVPGAGPRRVPCPVKLSPGQVRRAPRAAMGTAPSPEP